MERERSLSAHCPAQRGRRRPRRLRRNVRPPITPAEPQPVSQPAPQPPAAMDVEEEPNYEEALRPLSDEMDITQNHCSICLEDYDDRNSAFQVPCSHIFHSDCILMWFNNSPTCPVCRAEKRQSLISTYTTLYLGNI
uniref:RING-type domain-containing protein n=1 Tax=Leptobrachium leishanense TaxID=445787 RepID=A0A8C5PMS8_9ANUR